MRYVIAGTDAVKIEFQPARFAPAGPVIAITVTTWTAWSYT